jgi:pimeloyl-ACP methyl ester carboxylesterase
MRMKNKVFRFFRLGLFLLLTVYVMVCVYLYFFQENILFLPTKLHPSKELGFTQPFEELHIPVENAVLNAAFFPAQKTSLKHRNASNKLIFFLHGNAGNLALQDEQAAFYTKLGFDFFTFDYRGYGKSSGVISSEKQFYSDIQRVYRAVQNKFPDKEIYIVGYSLGTGPAAMLAHAVRSAKLILVAPYYSMAEMAIHRYKIFPVFLVRYPFETYHFLSKYSGKTLVVHGEDDAVLPFQGAWKLAKLLRNGDTFVRMSNQGHDHFTRKETFKHAVRSFLYQPIGSHKSKHE